MEYIRKKVQKSVIFDKLQHPNMLIKKIKEKFICIGIVIKNTHIYSVNPPSTGETYRTITLTT